VSSNCKRNSAKLKWPGSVPQIGHFGAGLTREHLEAGRPRAVPDGAARDDERRRGGDLGVGKLADLLQPDHHPILDRPVA